MAITTTSNPASTADRLQTLFHKTLMPHLQHTLTLGKLDGPQFTRDIPKHRGATTIRFFKKRKADDTNVQTLSQTSAHSTFAEMDTGYVDVSLDWLGEATKLSRLAADVDILDLVTEHAGSIIEDAALKYDRVIRDALVSSQQNVDSKFEQFCGVPATLDSSNDFASLATLSNANGKATRLEFLKAATTLYDNLVPTVDGGYVIAICPQVEFDMRQDDDWLAAATQSNPDKLYKREMLRLDGHRYVLGTNPFRESVYGTHSSSGPVFSSFVFGRGAFGTPKLEGTSNPAAPQLILNTKPDKSDPLNQFIVQGWKALWGAKALKTSLSGDVHHYVNVRARSTYND